MFDHDYRFHHGNLELQERACERQQVAPEAGALLVEEAGAFEGEARAKVDGHGEGPEVRVGAEAKAKAMV